jgi:hypothetical protein
LTILVVIFQTDQLLHENNVVVTVLVLLVARHGPMQVEFVMLKENLVTTDVSLQEFGLAQYRELEPLVPILKHSAQNQIPPLGTHKQLRL